MKERRANGRARLLPSHERSRETIRRLNAEYLAIRN